MTPFEFKNPFQLNFEWEALEASIIDEMTKLVTQDAEPKLIEGGPTVNEITMLRDQYKAGLGLKRLLENLRAIASGVVEHEKRADPYYVQKWTEMKRRHRVICFSAIANNILMWSHYADGHKGIVLGFKIEGARAPEVSYSREIKSSITLEDFVKYVTSQGPVPKPERPFESAAYTKSPDWEYEKEIRALRFIQPESEMFSDFEFNPDELKEIYFGCRTPEYSKEEIFAAANTFEAPIAFFQMQDEPLRFELTPVPFKVR
jgi:hypothetical protein